MLEAEQNRKPKPASAALVSEMKRLDALMLSMYGCTLDEYVNKFVSSALGDAYGVGFADGEKKGRSAGRRAAKGLKPAKAHGRPLEIDKGFRALMKFNVDRARTIGTPINQAIKDFLEVWRLGCKVRKISDTLPSVKKAKAAYYRDRKRTVPVSGF